MEPRAYTYYQSAPPCARPWVPSPTPKNRQREVEFEGKGREKGERRLRIFIFVQSCTSKSQHLNRTDADQVMTGIFSMCGRDHPWPQGRSEAKGSVLWPTCLSPVLWCPCTVDSRRLTYFSSVRMSVSTICLLWVQRTQNSWCNLHRPWTASA